MLSFHGGIWHGGWGGAERIGWQHGGWHHGWEHGWHGREQSNPLEAAIGLGGGLISSGISGLSNIFGPHYGAPPSNGYPQQGGQQQGNGYQQPTPLAPPQQQQTPPNSENSPGQPLYRKGSNEGQDNLEQRWVAYAQWQSEHGGQQNVQPAVLAANAYGVLAKAGINSGEYREAYNAYEQAAHAAAPARGAVQQASNTGNVAPTATPTNTVVARGPDNVGGGMG